MFGLFKRINKAEENWDSLKSYIEYLARVEESNWNISHRTRDRTGMKDCVQKINLLDDILNTIKRIENRK